MAGSTKSAVAMQSDPELEDGEAVKDRSSAELFMGQEGRGNGILYVTTSRVIWVAQNTETTTTFVVKYQNLTLHAICRDVSSFPRPCIYCQVDEDSNESEVRFVLADPDYLDSIFSSLTNCSSLNPDSAGDDDEDEEGADDERQAAVMNHLDSVFHIGNGVPDLTTVTGQFDDAESGED